MKLCKNLIFIIALMCASVSFAGTLPIPDLSGKDFRQAVNDALTGNTPIRPSTQVNALGVVTTAQTPDAGKGLKVSVFLGASIAMNMPINLHNVQDEEFLFTQPSSGGPFQPTWAAHYVGTIPALTTTANSVTSIRFVCVGPELGGPFCYFASSSVTGGSGSTPGGSSNSVQYNASGSLAGLSLGVNQTILGSAGAPVSASIPDCHSPLNALGFNTGSNSYLCNALNTLAGLGVGSTLASDGLNLNLPVTGISAGAYVCPNITTDIYGRITAITNGTCPGGGGVTNVTADTPLASSGGANPDISIGVPVPSTLGGTGTAYGSPSTQISVLNDSTTGTTINRLAKFSFAGTLSNLHSTAIITSHTDITGARGIVTAQDGTGGSAIVQFDGIANCDFDGPTTVNDFVIQSPLIDGECTDAGASMPSQQVIGTVMRTQLGPGSFPVQLFGLGSQTLPSSGNLLTYTNDGSTGTFINEIVKFQGASVVRSSRTDISGLQGICVANCGTTGSAVIQQIGQASCSFANTAVAGDYVVNSANTDGQCADAGVVAPASGGKQLVGRVLTSGTGIQQIDILAPENYGSGTSVAIANNLVFGGTVQNQLVTFVSNSTSVIVSGFQTNNILGVCASGCGTTGAAIIQQTGIGFCQFDGATSGGDYVGISHNTGGLCTDEGSVNPGNGEQMIGRVGTTIGGPGVAQVLFYPPESVSLTFPLPITLGGTGSTTGNDSIVMQVANQATIGTQIHHLAKFVSGTAQNILTTDTNHIIGVVNSWSGGSGTSGIAFVQTEGVTLCQFGGGGVAGDYVIASNVTAGVCTSVGSNPPVDGTTQIVGIRLGSGSGVKGIYMLPFRSPQIPATSVFTLTGTTPVAQTLANYFPTTSRENQILAAGVTVTSMTLPDSSHIFDGSVIHWHVQQPTSGSAGVLPTGTASTPLTAGAGTTLVATTDSHGNTVACPTIGTTTSATVASELWIDLLYNASQTEYLVMSCVKAN